VKGLLWHLLARGIPGTASAAEDRVLEYLADPNVNRRVFGQPLAGTVGYYLEDYLCVTQASERFARRCGSSVESGSAAKPGLSRPNEADYRPGKGARR
jgi:hypothetical protein